MQIPYRAIYTLLDKYYIRRSLEGYINDHIPPYIFEASKLFAHKLEDYLYLQVMVTDKDYLGNKYCLFVRQDEEQPIILEKDKDLSVFEVAVLSKKTSISKREFEIMLESCANSKGYSLEQILKDFEHGLSSITHPTVMTDKPKKDEPPNN